MTYRVCGIETYDKWIKLHLMSSEPTLNDGKGYKVLCELVPRSQEFESLSVGDTVRSRTINFKGSYRTFVYV